MASEGFRLTQILAPVWLAASALGCGGSVVEADSAAYCGDAVEQLGELCDDGNAIDGDGCNGDCRTSGHVQWCFDTDPAGISINPQATIAIPGGIVVAGDQAADGDTSREVGWLLALSAAGEQLWQRAVELPDVHELRLTDLVLGDDGATILVVGWLVPEPDAPQQAWLGEFDLATGTLIDERRYAAADTWLAAYSVARRGDTLVLGGTARPDAWIALLDEGRNIAWERRFDHGGGTDVVTRVLAGPTGQWTVVGEATSSVDPMDFEPLSMGFYRVFDETGGELIASTLAGDQAPGPSYGFADAIVWENEVLTVGAERWPFESVGHLWRIGAGATVGEIWTPPDRAQSSIAALAGRPAAGVFVGGTMGDQRWLARLEPDLESFAWVHAGEDGSLDSIAVAIDEPAIYAATTVFRTQGGTAASICKHSE